MRKFHYLNLGVQTPVYLDLDQTLYIDYIYILTQGYFIHFALEFKQLLESGGLYVKFSRASCRIYFITP